MDLALDISVPEGYTSPTQIARVVTEHWAETNLFCPACTVVGSSLDIISLLMFTTPVQWAANVGLRRPIWRLGKEYPTCCRTKAR